MRLPAFVPLLGVFTGALVACSPSPTGSTDGSVLLDAPAGDARGLADAADARSDGASDAVIPGDVAVVPDETNCVGATYHVSPSGNDSNDGSAARPWATVSKATTTVTTPGATIHVAAGTYTETAQLRLAPGVCLEGDGEASVIRSTLTADWTAILDAVSPEGTDGHQHISNLRFDGQNLATFWGINVAGRSNFSIHDTVVVDFKDRGVIMTGRDDNHEEPPTRYATGLSFYNNTVLNSAAYDTPNGVYGRGCLNVGGTEGMRIFNNTITQNQRPVGFNGWPIKAANGGYNRGLRIYNNRLTKIPFTGAMGGDRGWDFAVEMFWDQGTEFFGNTVSGAAFDTNHQTRGTYPYSLWIHDNVFTLPTVLSSNNHAVILEYESDGVIVENNTIDNFSNCIAFTPRPGSLIADTTIAGNLCSHVSLNTGDGSNASFINMGSGQSDFSIRGLNIYNNTFLADPNNRPWWGIELGGTTAGTITGVNIANNIIAHTYSGAIVQGAEGGVVMHDVVVSNNDIFDIRSSNDPVWTGTAPVNYTYANNIHVDPQFVSDVDYHLRAGSPAIDVGMNVGRPFAGTAPDLGYAER